MASTPSQLHKISNGLINRATFWCSTNTPIPEHRLNDCLVKFRSCWLRSRIVCSTQCISQLFWLVCGPHRLQSRQDGPSRPLSDILAVPHDLLRRDRIYPRKERHMMITSSEFETALSQVVRTPHSSPSLVDSRCLSYSGARHRSTRASTLGFIRSFPLTC